MLQRALIRLRGVGAGMSAMPALAAAAAAAPLAALPRAAGAACLLPPAASQLVLGGLRFKKERASDKAAAAAAAAEPAAPAEEDVGVSPKEIKAAMARHVDYAKREFGKLRGATANPNMLDHVQVEAYGEVQPLNAVAQISLKNPQLLVVNPFDAALSNAIGDAIRNAELNLNPSVEGNLVRVPLPKPSKESRDATLKLLAKIAESAKTRVRRVRQDVMDKLKKMEGQAGVSTDDVHRDMKLVQELTDAAGKDIAAAAEKKKAEIEQGA